MVARWAIPTEIAVRCRISINSPQLQFAHFDARLEPSSGHDGIRLRAEWSSPDDGRWVAAIERGVERFVAERQALGRPVCDTTLVMLRVISHPLVTTEATLSRHVFETLSRYFDEHASMVVE